MKKNLIIYLTVIGLIGLFSGCKKDMTNVVISASPVAPTIVTMPNLTLTRANGTQTIKFVGTPVDPGFKASATYILEACAHGNAFADAVTVLSQVQDTSMKIAVSDLNGILLKKFPGDQVSSVDFRIRSILVLDAGTGYTPMVYSSPIKTADVTLYGLPRLDLIGSGIDQKIESALGDGNYLGYVKLDITKPFTLKNPDAGTVYGGTNDVLAVNGSPLTAAGNGWSKLSVNTNALTYSLKLYNVGLIGSATPGQWSTDTPLLYNAQTGLWSITLDLTAGAVKFRLNNGWDNGLNLGLGDATHAEYTLTNLWNNGSSKDIPIAAAGNYTIKLSIGATTYSATITKN